MEAGLAAALVEGAELVMATTFVATAVFGGDNDGGNVASGVARSPATESQPAQSPRGHEIRNSLNFGFSARDNYDEAPIGREMRTVPADRAPAKVSAGPGDFHYFAGDTEPSPRPTVRVVKKGPGPSAPLPP